MGGGWTEDLAGTHANRTQLLLAGVGEGQHQLTVQSSNMSEWSQAGLQENHLPCSLLVEATPGRALPVG